MSIGLPNIIIIFFDWSTFEIMTLMSGFLGVKQQAVQIILMNLLALLLPYGIKQTSTALIGKCIGASKIKKAWNYYKHICVFAVAVMIVQYSLLWFNREYASKIFTEEEDVHKMMEKIIGLAIIVMSLDFIQESLCGTIKALCQQNKAMIINFISYYVIIIPLAYYFAFRSTNKQLLYLFQGGPDEETELQVNDGKSGLGMVGIWLGFITGMVHQITAYCLLIYYSNWQDAQGAAAKR